MRRKNFPGLILTLVHGSWRDWVLRVPVCMTIGLIDVLKWRIGEDELASDYVLFTWPQELRISL
jgi:hypothetical protein